MTGRTADTAMNEPLTESALARSVWHDFRHARRPLFVYEVLFKLLETWLFVPAVALLLSAVLSRAGRVAVSNRYILDFLLTPFGLVYAALLGTLSAALLLFEQAGIMVLAAPPSSSERRPGSCWSRTSAWNRSMACLSESPWTNRMA